MTTTSTEIFAADAEGFRAQNADRPPEQLVRELLQNALDEDGVTRLDVTVTYHGSRKGTTVVVKDDAPGGVRDARLLFTIWMSDKEDSPTARGRMGRGLKELVSVADETTVRTVSQDALVFARQRGGVWSRSTKPKLGRPDVGTEVTAFVRGWGEKAAGRIVAFLRRVRPPATIALIVNSESVGLRPEVETYNLYLPTVLYEVVGGERVARDRHCITKVSCFPPPPGERAYVYEMGIPVEECDSPVSIDVAQRVILRERRDTLTDAYRRELFAKILSARIDKIPDAALRDNAVLTAAASSWYLSQQASDRIVKAWTEGKPFAATPEARRIATGHHVEVVNLRSLPEAVRGMVKERGQNVQVVLDARRAEFCPPLDNASTTADQRRLALFYEWIAKGIDRPCTVSLRSGRPGAQADFQRDTRVLGIYVEAVGPEFFANPASAQALSLLCHELAHWTPREDEHGSAFHSDAEDVGGAVAAFLYANHDQARLLLEPVHA